jgi:uncharacterized protein YndB with AHSA1/START domain
MAAKSKSNEISITRIYDAPVQLVWDAWTDPKKVAKWWGPRGFTLTTHSKDLRVGGHWSYTMHGPDGMDYVNKTKYLEVEECARLVYDHGGNEDLDREPLFRVTATFKELEGGKTELKMTMAFPTPEIAKNMKGFIKKAGGEGTWDRLGEFLEERQTGKDIFIINRSFEAPIDVVFDMWTNPKHTVNWFGPAGAKMEYIRVDIREGGNAFYKMSTPDVRVMYGSAKYLEIVKPTRLVYTQDFRDANEKISRHPLAPIWPETMLTTVTFSEEESGRTRVTVAWEVYGNATDLERETFKKAKAGMTGGWTGSFDTLEEYLEKQK